MCVEDISVRNATGMQAIIQVKIVVIIPIMEAESIFTQDQEASDPLVAKRSPTMPPKTAPKTGTPARAFLRHLTGDLIRDHCCYAGILKERGSLSHYDLPKFTCDGFRTKDAPTAQPQAGCGEKIRYNRCVL